MSAVEAPEQAVILLDARGADAPLALREIGGRPFLDELVDNAARHGFSRITLLALRDGQPFAAYVHARRSRPRCTVTLAVAPDAGDAVAALRRADAVLDDRFLLLDGASFLDTNWLDLMLAAAAPSGPPRVVAARHPSGASGGVYLVDKGALADLPQAAPDLQPLDAMATGRGADGFFVDLRTPDGLARAQAELPKRRARPAVFFDRDGTLNADAGYVYRPQDLVFLPGAIAAVKRVNDLGRYAFLVTNQSGVARGYYTEADVRAFHALMQRRLRAAGAHLDDIRYCAEHPDGTVAAYKRNSDWRKPQPGMLLDLMRHWPVAAEQSLVVGNDERDIEAARAAGLRGARYDGGDLDAFLAAQLA
jgi:D-glycero-D-manno-heptose 1,7-bisphosphate phosphatase